MINFADLTRSGTAPTSVNATPKLKPGDTSSPIGLPHARAPIRPTTRGAEGGDLSELNVNLKINKRNNYGAQLDVYCGEGTQDDVGYMQAIESFQAAIDNWTDQRGTPSLRTENGASSGTGSPIGKSGSKFGDSGRPPNRKSGAVYSAYSQDPSSAIISSQRPKAVKSATSTGKEAKASVTESKISRNQQAVVAAYGGIPNTSKPPPTSMGSRPGTKSGSRPHISANAASREAVDQSTEHWASVDGAATKRPISHNVDRRAQSSTSPIDFNNKKHRRPVAPSPLLAMTPSPSKSTLQPTAAAVDRAFADASADNFEQNYEEDFAQDRADLSPGIYIDDSNGLDESFPDASHFELVKGNIKSNNNGSSSGKNSLLPVESDASFGYPMGSDDMDADFVPERPQSRKLYLGAASSSHDGSAKAASSTIKNPSPEDGRRKLPQSAGIRSVAMYPDVSIATLRRIPSLKDNIQFNINSGSEQLMSESNDTEEDAEEEVSDDCVTVVATDGDGAASVRRPPSRQRSAFPVHLVGSGGTTSSTANGNSNSNNSNVAIVVGAISSSSSNNNSISAASVATGSQSSSNSTNRGSSKGSNASIDSPSKAALTGATTVLSTGPMVVASRPIKLSGAYSNAVDSPLGNGSVQGDQFEDDDVDALERSISHASLQLQRPPSRQKLAAQHLFDHNNVRAAPLASSSSSNEAEGDLIVANATHNSSRRNSANRSGPNSAVAALSVEEGRGRIGSTSLSPERISDVLLQDMADIIAPATAAPSRRNSNNASVVKNSIPSSAPVQPSYRASSMLRHNDPVSDGFLELGGSNEDVPFQIIVNRSSPAIASARLGPSASPHPFSPFSDVSEADAYDMMPSSRSQTASNDYSTTSKLAPLMPSSNASARRGAGGAAAAAGNVSSGNATSSSSLNTSRPGRRFLSSSNTASSGERERSWASNGPNSPNGSSTNVRGSGGWMSATAERTAVSQAPVRSMGMSPSYHTLSAATLASQPQSQAQLFWDGNDGDSDFLTEANQSFADLSAAPSLMLLSLESSLDEDFLSLFAPGI